MSKSFTQCRYTNKRTAVRCSAKAFDGAKYCSTHQAAFERKLARDRDSEDDVAMGVLVPAQNETLVAAGMISHEDAEANGAFALMQEIRRTVARIRFCDIKINELAAQEGDNALIWGTTKIESQSGYDSKGAISVATVTKESKLSAWVELQRWERNHLKSLSKMWIDAGFEQRKLDLQAQTIDGLNAVIKSVVEGLGRSVNEQSVRELVTRSLQALVATDRPSAATIKATPVF